MFVGSYWSAREESKDVVANRVVAFLESVGQRLPWLTEWYAKGDSRRDALKRRVSPCPDDIIEHLSSERELLGFRLALWSPQGWSFSASLGSVSKFVGNSAVLSLRQPVSEVTERDWRAVLESMIQAFEPDHGVVTSHEVLAAAGADDPWGAGMWKYERGGVVAGE
jgi:hypothetical protein